jgi:hypothetical protein
MTSNSLKKSNYKKYCTQYNEVEILRRVKFENNKYQVINNKFENKLFFEKKNYRFKKANF